MKKKQKKINSQHSTAHSGSRSGIEDYNDVKYSFRVGKPDTFFDGSVAQGKLESDNHHSGL